MFPITYIFRFKYRPTTKQEIIFHRTVKYGNKRCLTIEYNVALEHVYRISHPLNIPDRIFEPKQ